MCDHIFGSLKVLIKRRADENGQSIQPSVEVTQHFHQLKKRQLQPVPSLVLLTSVTRTRHQTLETIMTSTANVNFMDLFLFNGYTNLATTVVSNLL